MRKLPYSFLPFHELFILYINIIIYKKILDVSNGNLCNVGTIEMDIKSPEGVYLFQNEYTYIY